MNRSSIIASSLAVAVFAAFAEDAATTIAVNASIKDGSLVKGEFCAQSITGSTIFAEKLDLDPAIVKSLAFSGTNGDTKVELTNGDKFAMTVANETFAVKSLIGDLAIPCACIRTLSLSKRKTAGGADEGLLFHCTFDDKAALESPKAGPSVNLELGQIAEREGKDGGALFVKPGIAGAEIRFPAGTFGPEGCIEFWANMASGKTEFSTGGDPRFFILLDGHGNEKAHLEFASNNGCGNSGFGGHFFGMRTQTNTGCTIMMPYSDIFKGRDYNGWHHYALAWTTTSLAAYIDGQEVCRTNGTLNIDEVAKSEIIMDIPLNRKTGRSFNNKSAFLMDDLKIWNFAKREFDLAN